MRAEEVRKLFELHYTGKFSAAHSMPQASGACASVHGHNYTIDIVLLCSELSDSGMVVDTQVLDKIVGTLDHINLNDVLGDWPTMENVARYLYDAVNTYLFRSQMNDDVKVIRITVDEGKGSKASLNIAYVDPEDV